MEIVVCFLAMQCSDEGIMYVFKVPAKVDSDFLPVTAFD